MTERPFRFGVQANNAATAHDWAEVARKVEDLGYSTLTMADHFSDQLAPGPALAVAATVTSHLRIGMLVYCNDYRHPVVMAKEVATLDVLSSGRFDFGLGAGWTTTDYEQSGIAFDRPGVRIDRMTEAIAICRGLLCGEPVNHIGEHYSIENMVGTPRPIQSPMPPLVIGGGGKRVLSLAAREADIVGVNLNLKSGVIGPEAGADGSPARTDEKLQWIREAAGERYDNIELNTRVHIASVTEDRVGLAEMLAAGLGLTTDDALNSPHALAGSVEQICEDLERIRDRWDISYFGISLDSIDAMAPVVAKMAGR